jgi:hypothetical protein
LAHPTQAPELLTQTKCSPKASDALDLLLIVDTGILLAAADTSDPDHDACVSLLTGEPGVLVTSPLIVAETSYLIGRQLGSQAEATFMRSIADGEVSMETLTSTDLNMIADLLDRYADLGLGAADASIVVLASRHSQRRIATLDHRHFSVVRPVAGGSFDLVP